MLKNIKYHISVAACFARHALQRQLEYPLFLVSWFLMVPTQWFVGTWMLKVIVDRFQPLAGWTFPQLAFIYGLGLISHGIMIVVFIQTWQIDHMVIHGGFDRMLLRPMNVFFQFSISFINLIGLFDMIPGVIVFVYACRLIGFEWSFINIFKLLLIIFGAVLIRCAFYTILCSAAFWTKRTWSMVILALNFLGRTTQYPLNMYPYILQVILTFIIPVAFICFFPACEFTGRQDLIPLPSSMAVWTPVIGTAMFVLANMVFMTGLRKYESSGS